MSEKSHAIRSELSNCCGIDQLTQGSPKLVMARTSWRSKLSDTQKLLEQILAREEEIVFDDILIEVARLEIPMDFHLFVRQKKLFQEPAQLEDDGYLVSPYLSIIYQNGSRQENNLAQLKQQMALCKKHKFFCLNYEYLMLYFDESVAERKKVPIKAFERLAELLSVYFHIYAFDATLNATARRLYATHKADPTKPAATDYAHLFNWNSDVFNVHSGYVRKVTTGELEIMQGNVDTKILPECQKLYKHVKYCFDSRRPAAGLAYHAGQKFYYKCFPIRGPITEQRDIAGCLLLIAINRRIPSHCAKYNEAAVNEIYTKNFLVERSRAVTRLHQELVDYSLSTQIRSTMKQRDSAFDEFAQRVVDIVCATTHAHSATIRLYEPFDRTLGLRAKCEIDGAAWMPTSDHSGLSVDGQRIPISLFATSVNAFCFMTVAAGSYIYLRNVKSIPQQFLNQGLTRAVNARTSTVSEFCIPLYWQTLRIGVMNVEAPFSSAFELDEEYLKLLSYLVAQRWFLVYFGTDRHWLSQISFTHLATHELAEFRRKLSLTQRAHFDAIVATLHFHQYGTDSPDKTVSDLIHFAKKRERKLTRRRTPGMTIVCRGQPLDMTIPAQMYSSLQLIFESILRNAIQHSDVTSDQVEIELFRASPGEYAELQITYSSSSAFVDPEQLERFFFEPKVDDEGLHYGLFLVGVHARLLGGTIAPNPTCLAEQDYGAFSYKIRIPYSEPRWSHE